MVFYRKIFFKKPTRLFELYHNFDLKSSFSVVFSYFPSVLSVFLLVLPKKTTLVTEL